MNDSTSNTADLKNFVKGTLELPLFGVCRTEVLFETVSDDIIEVVRKMPYGVVLGHPLSKGVLDTIEDRPNRIYKHHYQQVNWRLDRAALELASRIEMTGYKTLPIPASILVDWKEQRGHLSHRHAALDAGLGWRGRHGLVVTPEYGAQIRWVTVVTDMPLVPGEHLNEDCDNCRACIDVCPAGAITENGCDVARCFEKLIEFSKIQGVGQYICGVCIKACKGKRDG